MVDVSLSKSLTVDRGRRLVGGGAVGDRILRGLTFGSAMLVLIVLGGVFVSLVQGSLPALRAFGPSFLFTEGWNPVTEKFGALAPIYGTIITSAIALLIAEVMIVP